MLLSIFKKLKLLAVMLSVSFFFSGCDEEEQTPVTIDVYVAGSERENNLGVAKYWKNGKPEQLSTKSSLASAIVVAGEDVYVAGSEIGTSNAFYWKNGEQVLLTDIGTSCGIAVVGDDVHVIGNRLYDNPAPTPDLTTPLYWKNGTMSPLPLTVPGRSGVATGIFVDGTDVYISGTEEDRAAGGLVQSYPVVWKNGEIMVLDVPQSYQFGLQASSVKVVDGHVYVSGSIGAGDVNNHEFKAVYWKDNELTILPSGSTITFGLDLDVVEDDVYVVGYQAAPGTGWKGKYWVNGEEFFADGETSVNLYGIAVVDDLVYLAGDYFSASAPMAHYWVDGKRVPCGINSSYAYAIFVVKK